MVRHSLGVRIRRRPKGPGGGRFAPGEHCEQVESGIPLGIAPIDSSQAAERQTKTNSPLQQEYSRTDRALCLLTGHRWAMNIILLGDSFRECWRCGKREY